jgi:hypothetical protein
LVAVACVAQLPLAEFQGLETHFSIHPSSLPRGLVLQGDCITTPWKTVVSN